MLINVQVQIYYFLISSKPPNKNFKLSKIHFASRNFIIMFKLITNNSFKSQRFSSSHQFRIRSSPIFLFSKQFSTNLTGVKDGVGIQYDKLQSTNKLQTPPPRPHELVDSFLDGLEQQQQSNVKKVPMTMMDTICMTPLKTNMITTPSPNLLNTFNESEKQKDNIVTEVNSFLGELNKYSGTHFTYQFADLQKKEKDSFNTKTLLGYISGLVGCFYIGYEIGVGPFIAIPFIPIYLISVEYLKILKFREAKYTVQISKR